MRRSSWRFWSRSKTAWLMMTMALTRSVRPTSLQKVILWMIAEERRAKTSMKTILISDIGSAAKLMNEWTRSMLWSNLSKRVVKLTSNLTPTKLWDSRLKSSLRNARQTARVRCLLKKLRCASWVGQSKSSATNLTMISSLSCSIQWRNKAWEREKWLLTWSSFNSRLESLEF